MPAVYLIPSLLHEEGLSALPSYLLDAVLQCKVLFVENERSARRFLKKLSRDIVIDNFEWYSIDKNENELRKIFIEKLKEGKNAGVISEAGCPGIADPGQVLVAAAQEMNIPVRPLVGPNSILLALMASGMNGQQFRFLGYLPVDASERVQSIRELETESRKRNSTQIFIETPYRNDQIFASLLSTCQPGTRLCLAMNLTGKDEWIKTKKVGEWKLEKPALHKKPVIFLLYAGT